MNKIVISGYYGFANAGDEAMLTAIINTLRQLDPQAEITVITGNCAATAARHRVRAVKRTDFFAIVRSLAACSLVISGGGSLLQDVTSSRSLYYYLSIMGLAVALGKPVMLYAQGIGPVRRRMARKAVRRLLQHVQMISVRDRESKRDLTAMGVTVPPIHVTADAVLSMPTVTATAGEEILRRAGSDGTRRRVGISLREWRGVQQYKTAVAAAADVLQTEENVEIIFVPMQYPADVQAGEAVAALMKTPALVLREAYDTAEFMSLMACMDAVIANRLHALVFASLVHVPVTAVSYDPKIDSFMTGIGTGICGTVERVEAADVIGNVRRQLQQGGLTPAVQQRLQHVRRQSLRNTYLAARLLVGKEGVRKAWRRWCRLV